MVSLLPFFVLSLMLKHKSKRCDNNLERLECGSTHPHVCSDGPNPIKTYECVKNICGCKYPLILHNNTCIPYVECPDKCDKNSTFTNCDTPCPRRCSNLKRVSRPCSRKCVPNSCQCNVGYVLNDTNHCILIEDCPEYTPPPTTTTITTTRRPKKPKCKKNMFYSRCPDKKELICSSSKYERKENCGNPRCICKRGYAKYKNKCIKLWKCKYKLAKQLKKKLKKMEE
uniref:TIL domain-containing protein n=1 Tax=Strongyloides stercoralis TaxID=6248 RepID=A0AAF5DCG1_STRER